MLALLNDGLLPDGLRVLHVDSEALWTERNGVRLSLRDLSDGYRTVTALVLDLVKQLYACFGALGCASGPSRSARRDFCTPIQRSRAQRERSEPAISGTTNEPSRSTNGPLALAAQRAICRHPLASVLATLMDLLGSPRAASFVEEECIAAVHAHPEIRDWP